MQALFEGDKSGEEQLMELFSEDRGSSAVHVVVLVGVHVVVLVGEFTESTRRVFVPIRTQPFTFTHDHFGTGCNPSNSL
jgi:hypothetical protein